MVRIYDTTLRDGEQAPGFAMKIEEKLLIASHLQHLGVDAIEAGFPIASEDDFKAVNMIAQKCQDVEVSALCRCHEKDISRAIEALKPAKKPRIHVFIATSDLHLEHKLKITRAEAIEKAVEGVKLAKAFTDRVEFSCEDATRSEFTFLVEILNAVIEAGADVLNIPDTVGYAVPEEYGQLIYNLKNTLKASEPIILSTHCHDDLGLAVANSLMGMQQGAGQIECTINGIGERAGNAALEEIVMSIKTRSDIYHEAMHIHTHLIYPISRLLCQITGSMVQPNKAIVGRNAFAHGSGIHQHGMLQQKGTYEIMEPEDIGLKQSEIVLSKHSGRHALKHRLDLLGIYLSETELNSLFIKFKQLADQKKEIYDDDLVLLALHEDNLHQVYKLVDIKLGFNLKKSLAIVKLSIAGKTVKKSGSGNGPIKAAFNAIIKASGLEGRLESFHINSWTPDDESLGVVDISWRTPDEALWKGQDVDTNIVIAGAKALINLLNRKQMVESSRSTQDNIDKPFI